MALVGGVEVTAVWIGDEVMEELIVAELVVAVVEDVRLDGELFVWVGFWLINSWVGWVKWWCSDVLWVELWALEFVNG